MKQLVKQLIDQPLHFAWTFGAAFPLAYGLQPVGLAATLLAVNVLIIVWREAMQWPSKRWYDPPLDAAFFLVGAVTPFLIWRF